MSRFKPPSSWGKGVSEKRVLAPMTPPADTIPFGVFVEAGVLNATLDCVSLAERARMIEAMTIMNTSPIAYSGGSFAMRLSFHGYELSHPWKELVLKNANTLREAGLAFAQPIGMRALR